MFCRSSRSWLASSISFRHFVLDKRYSSNVPCIASFSSWTPLSSSSVFRCASAAFSIRRSRSCRSSSRACTLEPSSRDSARKSPNSSSAKRNNLLVSASRSSIACLWFASSIAPASVSFRRPSSSDTCRLCSVPSSSAMGTIA